MSIDEAPGTLADQAAAWVPPWARRPETSERPESQAPASADPVRDEAVDDDAADAHEAAFNDPSQPVGDETSCPVGDSASVESAGAEPVVTGSSGGAEPVGTGSSGGAEPAASTVSESSGAESSGAESSGAESSGAESPGAESPGSESEAKVVGGAAQARPTRVQDTDTRGALEAILLVVDEPVTEIVLAQVLEQPTETVADALHALSEEYSAGGRGFELRRAAGGWRLYTRSEYAGYVERFVLDGQQARLTQAALETLAVVAYKQPVTRSRISAIRGVNCDGVVRTLLARGLIEECGSEPDSGAFLYRTTTLFLEKLGLDGVEQLPPLAPFLPDDVEEVADAQRQT